MPDIPFSRTKTPRLAAALLAVGCALGLRVDGAGKASAACPEPASHGADLFTNGAVHQIRIVIQPLDLKRLRQDAREFVYATVSVAGTVYHDVGVHLKGSVGSFRPLDDKPSLTLDFSRFDGLQKLQGLRRIHLNNSVEDPSRLNEFLASEWFRAAALPAPRVATARVALNGRALGLYVLKEGYTEDFLAGHFQPVGGDLYEPGAGQDVDQRLKRNSVRAPQHGRAALEALASAAAELDPNERWQRLLGVLDVDRFLSFMALEVMLGHRDGYCLARNNFRVYHDLESNKMIFLPHGMDQLLGTADLPWKPHMAGLVARALLATAEGQRLYREHFVTLFHSTFSPDILTQRVDEAVRALRPSLSAGEFKDFEQQAGLVKDKMRRRAADLERQLAQPELGPLEFTDGGARPAGWTPADPPGTASMEASRSSDGKSALRIMASSATSASWRAKVLLPAGRYRFEGNAQVHGVEPLHFGAAQGAGLRVSGRVREGGNLVGNSEWKQLAIQFEVRAPAEELELVCELRASAGEAWFDADSLCLVQIR